MTLDPLTLLIVLYETCATLAVLAILAQSLFGNRKEH